MTDGFLAAVARRFPRASTLRVPLAEALTIEAVAACLVALVPLNHLELHGVKWRGRPKGSCLSIIHPPRPPLVESFPVTNSLQVWLETGRVPSVAFLP